MLYYFLINDMFLIYCPRSIWYGGVLGDVYVDKYFLFLENGEIDSYKQMFTEKGEMDFYF